ncbi:MAG: hypothetical protein M3033_01500 [Acidobacteriota bacterium]|nr:hypothetical protein [Acidobacteriota bacterium]
MSRTAFPYNLERPFGDYSFSVIFSNLFALIITVFIGYLCFQFGDGVGDYAFNILVVIIGALVGWALGMFFTPFSKEEGEKFTTISQTISVFISGYVFSKLDRYLELSMFDSNKIPVTIVWFRIGLLVSTLLVVMLTVFSNRAYFNPDDKSKELLIKEANEKITTIQNYVTARYPDSIVVGFRSDDSFIDKNKAGHYYTVILKQGNSEREIILNEFKFTAPDGTTFNRFRELTKEGINRLVPKQQ